MQRKVFYTFSATRKIKMDWQLKSKIWLEAGGQPVIGEGRLAMLQAIHLNNSIMRASQKTGISYRRIRGAIQDMENVLGHPLVQAYRGGRDGGGADLTPFAHDLSEFFCQLAEGLKDEVDERLRSITVQLP